MRNTFLACLALAFLTAPLRAQDFGGDSSASAPMTLTPQFLQLDIYGNRDHSFEDEPPSMEFAFGIGWASFTLDGPNSTIDGEGMLRFDPALTFALFERVPQLRLGVAVGVGLNFDNSQRVIISNENGLTVFGSSDVPLWTVEPEIRLSWRQYFGSQRVFFVEPGVAFGLVYANLNLDLDNGESFDESDTTVTGRAFLNVGWRQGVGAAGFQVSYMQGDNLDLAENASGNVEELYIGFFGAVRY